MFLLASISAGGGILFPFQCVLTWIQVRYIWTMMSNFLRLTVVSHFSASRTHCCSPAGLQLEPVNKQESFIILKEFSYCTPLFVMDVRGRSNGWSVMAAGQMFWDICRRSQEQSIHRQSIFHAIWGPPGAHIQGSFSRISEDIYLWARITWDPNHNLASEKIDCRKELYWKKRYVPYKGNIQYAMLYRLYTLWNYQWHPQLATMMLTGCGACRPLPDHLQHGKGADNGRCR
jgi:hypothetical protein